MASINKVILIGNLGRDPELRTFADGGKLANVSLATTERWKDKTTGQSKEATEWHSLVFNGRQAEIASQYLRKGSRIYIEGGLRTRKWQDKQTGQDRYSTEIRVDHMQMLGDMQPPEQKLHTTEAAKPTATVPGATPTPGAASLSATLPPPSLGSLADDFDDIPF